MYASNPRMFGTNASKSKKVSRAATLSALDMAKLSAVKKMEYSKHLEGLKVASERTTENQPTTERNSDASNTEVAARSTEKLISSEKSASSVNKPSDLNQTREQTIRMHKLAVKEQHKQLRRQHKHAQFLAAHQKHAQMVAEHQFQQEYAMHQAAAMAAYYPAYYYPQESGSQEFGFGEYGMEYGVPTQYSNETYFTSEEHYPLSGTTQPEEVFTAAEAGQFLGLDSQNFGNTYMQNQPETTTEQPCVSDSDYINRLIAKPLSLASVFAPPKEEVKEVTPVAVKEPLAVKEQTVEKDNDLSAPPGLGAPAPRDAPRDLSVLRGPSSRTDSPYASSVRSPRFAPRNDDSFAGLKPIAKSSFNAFDRRPRANAMSYGRNDINKAPSKLHTWMLRNIPCKLYQDELMQILNICGLEGKFDFFFTPVDAKKNALRRQKGAHDAKSNANNKGYAFINLKNVEDSDLLFRICNGKDFWARFSNTNSKKRCIVCPAQNQGLLENIKFFKESVLNHSLVAEYRNDCAQQGAATPSTVASSRWNHSPRLMGKRSESLLSDSISEISGFLSAGTYMRKNNLLMMDAEAVYRERELVDKRKRIVEAMQMPFFEYDESEFDGVEHFVDSMMEKHNL